MPYETSNSTEISGYSFDFLINATDTEDIMKKLPAEDKRIVPALAKHLLVDEMTERLKTALSDRFRELVIFAFQQGSPIKNVHVFTHSWKYAFNVAEPDPFFENKDLFPFRLLIEKEIDEMGRAFLDESRVVEKRGFSDRVNLFLTCEKLPALHVVWAVLEVLPPAPQSLLQCLGGSGTAVETKATSQKTPPPESVQVVPTSIPKPTGLASRALTILLEASRAKDSRSTGVKALCQAILHASGEITPTILQGIISSFQGYPSNKYYYLLGPVNTIFFKIPQHAQQVLIEALLNIQPPDALPPGIWLFTSYCTDYNEEISNHLTTTSKLPESVENAVLDILDKASGHPDHNVRESVIRAIRYATALPNIEFQRRLQGYQSRILDIFLHILQESADAGVALSGITTLLNSDSIDPTRMEQIAGILFTMTQRDPYRDTLFMTWVKVIPKLSDQMQERVINLILDLLQDWKPPRWDDEDNVAIYYCLSQAPNVSAARSEAIFKACSQHLAYSIESLTRLLPQFPQPLFLKVLEAILDFLNNSPDTYLQERSHCLADDLTKKLLDMLYSFPLGNLPFIPHISTFLQQLLPQLHNHSLEFAMGLLVAMFPHLSLQDQNAAVTIMAIQFIEQSIFSMEPVLKFWALARQDQRKEFIKAICLHLTSPFRDVRRDTARAIQKLSPTLSVEYRTLFLDPLLRYFKEKRSEVKEHAFEAIAEGRQVIPREYSSRVVHDIRLLDALHGLNYHKSKIIALQGLHIEFDVASARDYFSFITREFTGKNAFTLLRAFYYQLNVDLRPVIIPDVLALWKEVETKKVEKDAREKDQSVAMFALALFLPALSPPDWSKFIDELTGLVSTISYPSDEEWLVPVQCFPLLSGAEVEPILAAFEAQVKKITQSEDVHEGKDFYNSIKSLLQGMNTMVPPIRDRVAVILVSILDRIEIKCPPKLPSLLPLLSAEVQSQLVGMVYRQLGDKGNEEALAKAEAVQAQLSPEIRKQGITNLVKQLSLKSSDARESAGKTLARLLPVQDLEVQLRVFNQVLVAEPQEWVYSEEFAQAFINSFPKIPLVDRARFGEIMLSYCTSPKNEIQQVGFATLGQILHLLE